MRILKKNKAWLVLFGAFLLLTNPANAQIRGNKNTDSLKTLQDSLKTTKDSVKVKGDIETTVKYVAKDSLVYKMRSKMVFMYGNARVTYGKTQLDAENIQLDQANNTVSARGKVDSTGKKISIPTIQDGTEKYEAEAIDYNIKTRKAQVYKAVTQQGEAVVQGNRIRKDTEGNIYVEEGRYTTCNLAHPHFYIQSNKIKVIPQKQVVVGPFNFHLADIPTPLGFAFGIFPIFNTNKAKSGVIVPVYGEESRGRGFFLRNGGYYWAVSEYVGLQFLGEIYSKGGWGLNTNGTYTKKYAYNGSFSMRYNRRLTGEEGNRGEAIQDFWINWSHSPQSKGSSRFSASVNAGTNGFNRRNATQINNRVSNSFNSSISYSKTFIGTPFSMAATIRHDMNLSSGSFTPVSDQNTTTTNLAVPKAIMNMALPDISLNMNRIFPLNFSNITSSGTKWWQTFGISYSFRGTNQLTNSPQTTATSFPFQVFRDGFILNNNPPSQVDTLSFLADFPEVFKRGQIGAVHSIQGGWTMKLFKYFNLNPSFSYNETWYPRRLDFNYDEASGSVKVDTLGAFSRFYNYNMSAAITTRIFGTYNVGGRRVEAIRHTMMPSVSMFYTPDFSQERFGFFQRVPL
ncbi:MAG: LPS-assembly protein LptD, partial [Verrucomicrobia bacterium]|nr:LPS-assembly protein LptD [Cytophagales bacterium]